MRTLVFFAVFVSYCHAQIVIDTKIIGADAPLEQQALNTELADNSVPAAMTIQSSSGEEVIIQQCSRGTYTEGAATACVDCSAGTASDILGATTRLACQTCSAGAFSSQAASQCTLCSVGTFSPNAGAVDDNACLQCPPNSNSTVGTDSVTKCSCNDRFFLPANLMQPLDPKAPVQFASWAALAVGVLLVDVPHLSC
jgi:hypothetical protein